MRALLLLFLFGFGLERANACVWPYASYVYRLGEDYWAGRLDLNFGVGGTLCLDTNTKNLYFQVFQTTSGLNPTSLFDHAEIEGSFDGIHLHIIRYSDFRSVYSSAEDGRSLIHGMTTAESSYNLDGIRYKIDQSGYNSAVAAHRANLREAAQIGLASPAVSTSVQNSITNATNLQTSLCATPPSSFSVNRLTKSQLQFLRETCNGGAQDGLNEGKDQITENHTGVIKADYETVTPPPLTAAYQSERLIPGQTYEVSATAGSGQPGPDGLWASGPLLLTRWYINIPADFFSADAKPTVVTQVCQDEERLDQKLKEYISFLNQSGFRFPLGSGEVNNFVSANVTLVWKIIDAEIQLGARMAELLTLNKKKFNAPSVSEAIGITRANGMNYWGCSEQALTLVDHLKNSGQFPDWQFTTATEPYSVLGMQLADHQFVVATHKSGFKAYLDSWTGYEGRMIGTCVKRWGALK
jgi:hypothetical protein